MLVLAYCGFMLVGSRLVEWMRGLPVILHFQWMALIAAYLMFEGQFVPLRAETQLAVCGFLFAFSIGFGLGPFRMRFRVPQGDWVSRRAFYALSASLAAVTLARAATLLIASGGFAALRASLGADGAEAPSIGIAVSFPMASTAWLLARLSGQRARATQFAVLTFALAVATTSKVFLFIWLLQLLPLEREWQARDVVRVGLAFGVLGLLAFVGLHLLLGKVVQGEASIFVLLARTFLTYLLSGIAGLNILFQHDTVFPANSMWIRFGQILPWTVDVPDSPILPWVRIGDWNGNVYTAFSYWIDGWGPAGFVAWSALLGLLVRTIRSQTDLASQTFFRLSVFSLLMAFHQDFILPSLYLWIAFAAAASVGMQVAPASIPRGRHV